LFNDIGILFPVRRLARKLKKASQLHVGIAPAIFLAAVLQYLITEIFDLTVSEPKLLTLKSIVIFKLNKLDVL